jgi:hypothetical protein
MLRLPTLACGSQRKYLLQVIALVLPTHHIPLHISAGLDLERRTGPDRLEGPTDGANRPATPAIVPHGPLNLATNQDSLSDCCTAPVRSKPGNGRTGHLSLIRMQTRRGRPPWRHHRHRPLSETQARRGRLPDWPGSVAPPAARGRGRLCRLGRSTDDEARNLTHHLSEDMSMQQPGLHLSTTKRQTRTAEV